MAAENGNAAVWFVDRHVAGAAADKPAFIEAGEGGRTLTYAELGRESGRMAALYERFGVNREDRVALLLLDTADFPVIFWGSLKSGVIPVALNTLLSTEVYAAILADSRAKALFVSPELLETVLPALAGNPWLKHVFVAGPTEASGMSGLAAELAKGDSRPSVEADPDECAFWLYSSGSTGKPKGVRHVHSNLKATADTYGAQVLGIESSDTVYSAAKLFFAYGLGNAMTFPMSVGATTVLFSG
ncbi:MAG TPA: AMP-binding protein, partial [Rhizobiaceae bacterium]|nr:AMP-binding protein [Rhizobiaceae bacterium]